MAGHQSIKVDHALLLSVIGLIEWSVANGQMTYEQALAVTHAAVDEAITRPLSNGNEFEPEF
jgi:hypothetical protein